jgi:hypothetical protein
MVHTTGVTHATTVHIVGQLNQLHSAEPRPRLPNTGYKAQQVNRKLTNMEVAEIIMSPLTNRELACVYPISHQSIQKIQAGKNIS